MRYTNPRLLYFTLNDFCCFRCVIEQWALTVIKLLRFFCIIIYYLLFFTIFYFFLYYNGTESSKFHQQCACFWFIHPHKTRTFSVRLYDQGNGFAAEVLVLVMPKFKLRSRLRPPDANNCCTQTDRQRSEIWPPKFRRNWLTHPASRRPNFIETRWLLLR